MMAVIWWYCAYQKIVFYGIFHFDCVINEFLKLSVKSILSKDDSDIMKFPLFASQESSRLSAGSTRNGVNTAFIGKVKMRHVRTATFRILVHLSSTFGTIVTLHRIFSNRLYKI
jgi:hypothetical protein